MTLKKAGSAEIVQQTTSAVGGGYTFEKVLPGSYRVEASHPTWMFDSVSWFDQHFNDELH